VSPAMGSSGTKKNRKGKHPQHLAKVGTPAENAHTMHAAERDVVGNFGVHGKGVLFWVAVVIIAVIAIGGIVTLALL
jgi:cytochrome b subunit of formate dehydrogenase